MKPLRSRQSAILWYFSMLKVNSCKIMTYTHSVSDNQIPRLDLNIFHFFHSQHSVPGTLIED